MKFGPSWKSGKLATVVIIVIIAAFTTVAANSVRNDSLTIDETAHLVSGYATLRYGYAGLNPEHPPLIKLVAAIPLLSLPIMYLPPVADQSSNQWDEGQRFLFESGISIDAVLSRARLAVILFNALLLAGIAAIALRVFRHRLSAIMLLVFLAFGITLFAHARYVTTDTPIALAITGLVLSLSAYRRAPSRSGLAWIGAFLTLVITVKFSGILAFALGIVSLLFLVKKDPRRTKKVLLSLLIPLTLAYLISLPVTINTPSGHLNRIVRTWVVSPALRETTSWMAQSPVLRPVLSYAIGVFAVAGRSQVRGGGDFIQFLDGEGREGRGWRSYFLRATLYKETPALLMLLATSLFLWRPRAWRTKRVAPPTALHSSQRKHSSLATSYVVPFTFFVAYLFASIFIDLNIGIRHFAPVLALATLLSILIVDRFLEAASKNTRILLSTFYLLLITSHVVSIATTYPYFLGYFNAGAGGWEKGYTHLIDSNLDWGENLKRLSTWVYENNIPSIAVDYWGKSPLNTYDPEFRLKPWHIEDGKPTGYFAVATQWISHSTWAKKQGEIPSDYSFLEQLQPIKKFGGGLWVYELH